MLLFTVDFKKQAVPTYRLKQSDDNRTTTAVECNKKLLKYIKAWIQQACTKNEHFNSSNFSPSLMYLSNSSQCDKLMWATKRQDREKSTIGAESPETLVGINYDHLGCHIGAPWEGNGLGPPRKSDRMNISLLN